MQIPEGVEIRGVEEVGLALPALQADVRFAEYEVDVALGGPVGGEDRRLTMDAGGGEAGNDPSSPVHSPSSAANRVSTPEQLRRAVEAFLAAESDPVGAQTGGRGAHVRHPRASSRSRSSNAAMIAPRLRMLLKNDNSGSGRPEQVAAALGLARAVAHPPHAADPRRDVAGAGGVAQARTVRKLMRLLLIRHGETDHNRGGITLGRADVPLNATGRAQAGAVAASFYPPPAAIYSSPLSRALDTADAIGSATGVPVSIDDALIEMDVGEMEHLTRDELRAKYPEFLGEWMAGETAAEARMPGGETLREVQERAWAAIERLRDAHPDGDVVAVTHNFVILTIVCRTLELPLSGFRRIRHGVGAITTIEVGPTGSQLVALNERGHLATGG